MIWISTALLLLNPTSDYGASTTAKYYGIPQTITDGKLPATSATISGVTLEPLTENESISLHDARQEYFAARYVADVYEQRLRDLLLTLKHSHGDTESSASASETPCGHMAVTVTIKGDYAIVEREWIGCQTPRTEEKKVDEQP